MQFFGLVGSPRRNGNTHILVESVLEGAREAGASTDLACLSDRHVEECDGCHACWRGGDCVKADDMQPLYRAVAAADVVVFGTPVYWYGPTALMKAVLDRFVFFNCPAHRPEIRGKRGVVAVPFEEAPVETADLVLALFARCFKHLEMDHAGQVLAPGVGEKGEVLKHPGVLEEAYALGQSLGVGATV